ncbi:endonuclease/exonuclease/phosphatase family protein [Rhodovulum visakhapatnamense]|uniref:Endonuclease/exonuclease/phosphatase domain-containing protein n=1 Tax=Rhodovulum visakhapatnamense TaxID=364297 RepID=A0A4R8F8G0_9RHOB|nr:endonuclease/exonuclease/phosphatase family protein [Rhodovulum visakhapatnamense]TDX21880.1 hypothetical protein EV657_13518 [Rhodovulum visakhapatnamense]
MLFFNAFAGDETRAERIVSAAMAKDPDVIVFAESRAVGPALAQLKDRYEVLPGCSPESCEVLVAVKRKPVRFWTLQLNPVFEARYAFAELETPSGKRVALAASQSVKPWFTGGAEAEREKIAAQYRWITGPVVAVGDFNAPPWSRPMRLLLHKTGMRGLRRPVATWPAGLGRFGLPIDQILVRGGARVVHAER